MTKNNKNNNFNNFLLWIKNHFILIFCFCSSVSAYIIINSKTKITTNASTTNKPTEAFIITSLTQEETNFNCRI